MSTIAELLAPETRQRLAQVEFVVTKKATDPNPPRRPLTLADAIEIDPKSEALIEARCVDCGYTVLINPQLPEGVDPEIGRIPMCTDCHQIRTREAKTHGSFVRHVHRPVKPAVRVQTPVQKESPVIDLDNLTDAELGAQVRTSMKATIASEVPAKREAAKEKEAEVQQKERALFETERESRRGVVLPEFTLHGVTVPSLDLGEVTNVDEAVSAKVRSPYNKVLYRSGEPLLPSGDPDDATAPRATYADVAQAHRRLQPKQPARQSVRLVADIDPGAKAKVETFAEVTGKTYEQALEHLTRVGVL